MTQALIVNVPAGSTLEDTELAVDECLGMWSTGFAHLFDELYWIENDGEKIVIRDFANDNVMYEAMGRLVDEGHSVTCVEENA
jgi:hypothetical protein